MNMNECVKRLAILYMVKSGRIAKSAQSVSMIRPARVPWWHSMVGRLLPSWNTYVQPRSAMLQGVFAHLTPELRSKYLKAYEDALLQAVGKELEKAGTPDQVKNSVLSAARNAFYNARFPTEERTTSDGLKYLHMDRNYNINDLLNAARKAAQDEYNSLARKAAASHKNLAADNPELASKAWFKNKINFRDMPIVSTEIEKILDPHIRNINNWLLATWHVYDPSIVKEISRELDAIGRGERFYESGPRSLPKVLEDAILSGKPESPIGEIIYELRKLLIPTGLAAAEVSRRRMEQSRYSGLKSRYSDLESRYSDLESKYYDLQSRYSDLQSRYSATQSTPLSGDQPAQTQDFDEQQPLHELPATEVLKRRLKGQQMSNR